MLRRLQSISQDGLTLDEFNRRKLEIETKLIFGKDNAAKGGTNWKIKPLTHKPSYNVIKMLNYPSFW